MTLFTSTAFAAGGWIERCGIGARRSAVAIKALELMLTVASGRVSWKCSASNSVVFLQLEKLLISGIFVTTRYRNSVAGSFFREIA